MVKVICLSISLLRRLILSEFGYFHYSHMCDRLYYFCTKTMNMTCSRGRPRSLYSSEFHLKICCYDLMFGRASNTSNVPFWCGRSARVRHIGSSRLLSILVTRGSLYTYIHTSRTYWISEILKISLRYSLKRCVHYFYHAPPYIHLCRVFFMQHDTNKRFSQCMAK